MGQVHGTLEHQVADVCLALIFEIICEIFALEGSGKLLIGSDADDISAEKIIVGFLGKAVDEDQVHVSGCLHAGPHVIGIGDIDDRRVPALCLCLLDSLDDFGGIISGMLDYQVHAVVLCVALIEVFPLAFLYL